MATVYLAHDLKHDRRVAPKVLHPELATILGPERFQREIRTTARLQHPQILAVHDSARSCRPPPRDYGVAYNDKPTFRSAVALAHANVEVAGGGRLQGQWHSRLTYYLNAGSRMSNFSKDQLDKIRALLEKAGVESKCPTCKRGMLVLDRGQFGLQEVAQVRENATGAPGGAPESTGRIATCVLLACSSCGFVRLHSLTALGLDSMM
jgi:hypothetical protein